MTEDWMQQRKLERLRGRWTLLDKKLTVVQEQYDREGRAEERLRMQAIIQQTEQELLEVERDITALGGTIPITSNHAPAQTPAQDLPVGDNVNRTVLELDLVGYRRLLRLLEDNLGVQAAGQLNAQIQGFVDEGLQAVTLTRAATVAKTTGDGAILLFERAADAHQFAGALYTAAATFNRERKPEAWRRFRIGAATGQVAVSTHDGVRDIAGSVIATAVRLESAAKPGELLIDPKTYAALPVELQRLYGPEEQVKDKNNESDRAHRCRLSPEPAETETDSAPTVDDVLALFKQLNPRDQLEMIMLRLEMPAQHRPSAGLTLTEREMKVIEWAKRKDGCRRLAALLREMIAEQERD